MKKILKLMVLFLVSNFGYSQIYYSHYLDATSEWRIIEHHGEASYHNIYFKTIFFDGFENINGYTYYKMYQTYYTIGYEVDYSVVISPQSGNITQFIGYFREDATGKFYLYNNGAEMIYFDNQSVLSAQIGDFFYGQLSQSSCQIDYIGNNILNGINLKQIKCDTISTNNGTGNSVEGIGNVHNSCYSIWQEDNSLMTFERTYFYSKQGQSLTFYDNVYTLIGTTGYIYYFSFANADHQGLSTLSYENSSFKVFPNPAKTIVNITSNNKNIKEIILSDMQGRILKTIEVNKINTQFDISNYQAGTYLLTIKTDFGISNSKLIIE